MMQFTSTEVKGASLGQKIGYPTINLLIPKFLNLDHGVYECTVKIQLRNFAGILYFGPKSLERRKTITLEIHLILNNNTSLQKLLNNRNQRDPITVQVRKLIRLPKNFISLSFLRNQIQKDVNKLTRKLCKPMLIKLY